MSGSRLPAVRFKFEVSAVVLAFVFAMRRMTCVFLRLPQDGGMGMDLPCGMR